MKRLRILTLFLPVAFAAAGCAASKSSDPLSPTVAGPIPGVTITPPVPVDPVAGFRVIAANQPLTLTVANATTSGVRPLSYLFDVATDAGFTNKVFSRDNITPDTSGKTGLKLPDPLQAGHTYYWRAQAHDGANTSDYSSAANFDVYTPVVLDAPTLMAPIAVATVTQTNPTFVIGDSTRSGPVGAVSYTVELSDTDTFANKLAIWTVAETANQTSLPSPQNLAYAKTYFWHARAFDPTTVGPWSATQAFVTPQPPAPPPPPPSGGGGSGGGTTPSGDWTSCSSLRTAALITCLDNIYQGQDEASDFEVVKRAAWILRNEGGGLLLKPSGDNIITWQGQSFSSSRVCQPAGELWKLFADAGPGGANTPEWVDSGPIDPSTCVAPINPDLP